MRSVQRLCLDVLGVKEELPGTALSFASAETIRERAPKQVTKPETLDFQTLTPEKGGLFDYRVFGPGTVIDAAPLSEHELIKPPKTQFARVTLALPIVNPLVVAHAPDDLAERASVSAQMLELGDDYGNLVDALQLAGLNGMVLRELPVLPPDLRPLRRLEDDRWAISPLNDLYRHVVYRNNRLARLVEQSAPDVILAGERKQLHEAILHLFDGHADRSHSLRGVCGEELVTALLELDKQPVTPGETMLARHYRALAVVFALGFDMGRAG